MHGLTLVGGGGSDDFVVGVESVDDLGPGGGHTCSCGLPVQSAVLRVVHNVGRHL
jgi:hypothetical protein